MFDSGGNPYPNQTWVDGTFKCTDYTLEITTPPETDTVTVENLVNSMKWDATMNVSSGSYELKLVGGMEVNATETLRIISCDVPDNHTMSCNVTDHVVVTCPGTDTVNILALDHYCMNYYPEYQWFTQEDPDYSGAAVMQMWTDFKGLSHTQDDLQAWGLTNNTAADQAAGLQHVDPRGMANVLNNLLPEHFTVGRMDNSTLGLEFALHRICWWQYLGPGALPTGGNYTKWMSVRGIHTDDNPHNGNYHAPYGYNVSGFWINDPHNESIQGAGGIGANSYKTAEEWTETYYKVIVDPYNNETGGPWYDNFDDKYITVLEPPPDGDFAVGIVPAKPRFTDAITPVLAEKTLMVYDVEQLALEKVVKDDEMLKIVQAAIDGVDEELIPYDAAFAEVFAKATAGEPMLVTDDGGNDYYIVPFNVPVEVKPFRKMPIAEIERVKVVNAARKLERVKRIDDVVIIRPVPKPIVVEKTLVVVLVDAADGSFKETSWVADPMKYLPVSKEEALKLALYKVQITAREDLSNLMSKPTIELVQRGSSGQYYPDWKVTVNGEVFYVSQDGTVS